MYIAKAISGREQREPKIAISGSLGPIKPSKSESSKPTKIKTTNCDKIYKSRTIPNMRYIVIQGFAGLAKPTSPGKGVNG